MLSLYVYKLTAGFFSSPLGSNCTVVVTPEHHESVIDLAIGQDFNTLFYLGPKLLPSSGWVAIQLPVAGLPFGWQKRVEMARGRARLRWIPEAGVTVPRWVCTWFKVGRDYAFEQEILRKGAQPFFTVVTMGDRAALADVYASDRALAKGDLVRFDLGCVYQGYRSDISRTAVLGAPTDKQRRYYDAIRDGERAAIAAMKPGVPVNQIFEIGMRVTRETGMPHYTRNHVGHGIGLEPYDPPTINAATETLLEPGMVFCVETPYYEHGWGGVQVEDAVEITATGVRQLTRSSQELHILG